MSDETRTKKPYITNPERRREQRAIEISSQGLNPPGTGKLMSNALTSSFRYSCAEVRAAFEDSVRDTPGATISGTLNQLIIDHLATIGIELDPGITTPRKSGRPIGSRNSFRAQARPKKPHYFSDDAPAATVSGAAVEESVKQLPKQRKASLEAPSDLDIETTIKSAGTGVFPVGRPRKLSQADIDELKRLANAKEVLYNITDAVYIDEDGNYFDDAWWYYNGQFFAGNTGYGREYLALRAIEKGVWYPTSADDYRIRDQKITKSELFGDYGYLVEGNGRDQGMTIADWRAEIKNRGLRF